MLAAHLSGARGMHKHWRRLTQTRFTTTPTASKEAIVA